MKIVATQVGGQTVLAQIIRLVERAQGSKLPIQQLADRVVRVFTPIVIVVAFLTFVAWLALGPAPAISMALVSAVAVLVVACPCAMGLATPAAIMVASGRAAELGVLFRKGEALETLSRIDTVAFDKTGTLTEGRPRLTDLFPLGGGSRRRAASGGGGRGRQRTPPGHGHLRGRKRGGNRCARGEQLSGHPRIRGSGPRRGTHRAARAPSGS